MERPDSPSLGQIDRTTDLGRHCLRLRLPHGLGEIPHDSESEEGPDGGSGQAGTSDFLGEPGGDGTSAPRAIAAKDPASATGPSAETLIIEAKERTMANESTDPVAMRTSDALEPLH
jgi:hypothetical protein